MKKSVSKHVAVLCAKEVVIAAISLAAIALHLLLRFGVGSTGAVFAICDGDGGLLTGVEIATCLTCSWVSGRLLK